jgi:hypothetical protein
MIITTNIIPYVVGALLLVGAFFLGRSFSDTHIETETVTVTEVRTVTKIDTVYIEVPRIVEIQIPAPIHEPDTQLNRYESVITDTLITGTITTWTTGEMHRQILDYTPLFPKYITRTDSVFVDRKTTITHTRYPSGFFIGADAGIKGISPHIHYIKQHYGIGYRYDPFFNAHNISFMIRL